MPRLFLVRALTAAVLATLAAHPRTARAASPATSPAATAPSPALDGVYHVEMKDEKGLVRLALIVVDRTMGKPEVFFIMDETTTPLAGVHGDEHGVAGRLDTSRGQGVVRFDVADRRVTGTLTVGRHTFAITGTRTV